MEEKAAKFEDALESLIQAKQILEDNYGLVDKRTTRVKRNISLIRLKLGMIPEALQEMKEVEVSYKRSVAIYTDPGQVCYFGVLERTTGCLIDI